MTDAGDELFELREELPNDELNFRSRRLVGFDARFSRLQSQFMLIVEEKRVKDWSVQFHGADEVISDVLHDRCPLVVFHGDVGTGKTTTAESCADSLVRSLKVEGILLKLSTRVRGIGHVGEMSTLIGAAFDEATAAAGKHRYVTLIIDEGDAIAFDRSAERAHHEDRVGVNTLIQRIDAARVLKGRLLIVLCSNRYTSLDPAILRRASLLEYFGRPSENERRQLLKMTLTGVALKEEELNELVRLTGASGDLPGFTFSDIQTKLIPVAVSQSFPDRALTFSDLENALKEVRPSPIMRDGGEN